MEKVVTCDTCRTVIEMPDDPSGRTDWHVVIERPTNLSGPEDQGPHVERRAHRYWFCGHGCLSHWAKNPDPDS
jgi:hypothetical protein